MHTPEQPHSPTPGKWFTIAIWLVGIALQVARPWLIAFFRLNTEVFMISFMGPVWAFLLVCLLTGFLRVFRRLAKKWSQHWRVVFALVLSVVLALPQIDLIMLFRESDRFPHYIDPMRLQLFWGTPLVFYALPAVVVVASWLRHNRPISTRRALGLALVIYGVVYVPFGLWVNQLILKYTQP
jgi:hypothetical protein